MKYYRFFEFLFLLPGIALILFSANKIMMEGTWFTYLRIGPFSLHAWTAMIGGFSYFLSCKFLNSLPLFLRNLYAIALVISGGHLYDTFWGFGSVLSGSGGFPVVPLMGLIGSIILLIWLEFRNMYLQLNRAALIPLSIMIICISIMAFTGFFHEMNLYSVGLASDPNVGNWCWMVSKATGLMVFPLLTRRGNEVREMRWWI